MTAWTEERRRKQAEAIRRWKPWEKSTGPRTAVGKAHSKINAYKGVARREAEKMNALHDAFRLQYMIFQLAERVLARLMRELLKDPRFQALREKHPPP